MIELKSSSQVSDGRWHQLRAQFNPTYMELGVDGERKSQRTRSDGSKSALEINGPIYFGKLNQKQVLTRVLA